MSRARDKAVEGRSDFSRFVVHLTRDDTGESDGGGTAREHFDGIAKERKIRAWRPHCLHMDRIPRKHWGRFGRRTGRGGLWLGAARRPLVGLSS